VKGAGFETYLGTIDSESLFNVDERNSQLFLYISQYVRVQHVAKSSLRTGTHTRLRTYKRVSKNFRIGRLERELQMVYLSANKCSCIAICESA
jgi:hypothetical protein